MSTRVVGVVRLSRASDDSTSVARQRELIERWCRENGATLAGWAEDEDVSGSTDPTERPGLGPWLKARATEWDALVAWRLDRYGRSVRHVATLLDWCDEHGKRLVTTDDGVDSADPTKRFLTDVMAAFGAAELAAISARTKAGTAKLLKEGRYRGGIAPYGYRSEPRPEGGHRLVIDAATADVVRDIAARVINGESVNSVCESLNAAHVPSPRDAYRLRLGNPPNKRAAWSSGNLKHLLTSHTLRGFAEEHGKGPDGKRTRRPIRGADGLPLERAEGILTADEWERLQVALEVRAFRRKRRDKPGALLTGVIECECGHRAYRKAGRSAEYYVCSSLPLTGKACGSKSVRVDHADAEVTAGFLARVGRLRVTERRFVAGSPEAAHLARAEKALEDLWEDRAAGLYEGDAATYQSRYLQQKAKRDALAAKPLQQDRWEDVPTGETYGERFAAMADDAARNVELRRLGIRVVVSAEGHLQPALPGLGGVPVRGSRLALVLPGELEARATAPE